MLHSGANFRPTADVCLIVEGCYPFVRGGVSSWLDWLIRSQPDLLFHIVSIWPRPGDQRPLYALPDNAAAIDYLYLYPALGRPPRIRNQTELATRISAKLSALVTSCDLSDLRELDHAIRDLSPDQLLGSRLTWQVVQRTYRDLMPNSAFLDYFWAWRSLFGGLFSVLKHPLPQARIYHAVSTGYAGLLAAKASSVSGMPTIVTEHGIYTNERRIEILLADWINDSIQRGFDLKDCRIDLRDLWIRAFENYAGLCYQGCSRIITLYSDNQRMQREAGAASEKLQIIPNGVDLACYAGLARPAPDAPPTMALIGRVTPIKDVLSFIRAAALVRREIPGLRALILGPTDEDPAYYEECVAAVRNLEDPSFITFTGPVNVSSYLPDIHVVVLTSLSEGQPLVVLEAGAAGIPCVTTDVGACREILEACVEEGSSLGPGGIVTSVVAPEEVAAAVTQLLRDPERRLRMGASLKQRMSRYRIEVAAERYRTLYNSLDSHGTLEERRSA